MFIGRRNHFKCNGCDATVAVIKYPKGWIYITPKMGVIEHYCVDCQEGGKVPEGVKQFKEGEK